MVVMLAILMFIVYVMNAPVIFHHVLEGSWVESALLTLGSPFFLPAGLIGTLFLP